MSRSVKKVVAWGKSTRGHAARHNNKTWGDYQAAKARKEGKPIKRQHFRGKLQTLRDFEKYVQEGCGVNQDTCDKYDRDAQKGYLDYAAQHAASMPMELINKNYAKVLYNKQHSK